MATKTTQATSLPKPVQTESRICFGIEWYATEADAVAVGKHVRERGDRYNGGWFDGMECGRAPGHDRDGLFAVTVS